MQQPAQTSENYDLLTGLLTEDAMTADLDRLLFSKTGCPPATLALLQLENFYEIRSWIGESEANALLAEVAHWLQRAMPKATAICRCRNHEFAVLLTGKYNVRSANLVAKIKRIAARAVSSALPPQLDLQCGIGLASMGPGSRAPIADARVLFARARHDLSLSHTQRSSISSSELLAPLSAARKLKLLSGALADQQLRVNFQQLVSLDDTCSKVFELRTALDPSITPGIAPILLLESAVQNALGETIDRWVIGSACAFLDRESYRDYHFVVSVTQNSIVSQEFIPWLTALLGRNPRLAGQLSLQVSEVDILSSQHHMDHFSRSLRRLDVGLWINHFGCTADPFRYLNLLRAHSVKLDPSRLEKVAVDVQQRKALIALLQQAESNNLVVVAPKQEQMRQIPLLWRCGIRWIQGFCIGSPEELPVPCRDLRLEFGKSSPA